MTTDWTGNHKSIAVINGLNGHAASVRERNDYYATDPQAIDHLLLVGWGTTKV